MKQEELLISERDVEIAHRVAGWEVRSSSRRYCEGGKEALERLKRTATDGSTTARRTTARLRPLCHPRGRRALYGPPAPGALLGAPAN